MESLPVPVSPKIKMVESVGGNLLDLLPAPCPSWSGWLIGSKSCPKVVAAGTKVN